ncbi:MAG: LysR family transcriptional regulator [Lachnospiraceae bacterium]
MNWNQIQYVITVAEEKNITRAAEKLYISQPSLSLSIQSLERELNTSLFFRSKGEIQLTHAGELFLEWAQLTVHSHQQLLKKLNDLAKNQYQPIQIGISPHRSTLLLPPILEKFYEKYPETQVLVVEKPTYLLKELLKKNQIDFMIDVPHSDTVNFKSELLLEEKLMLAVPKSFTEKLCQIGSDFAEKRCNEEMSQFYEEKIALDAMENTISLSQTCSLPYIMLSADHILGRMSRTICESDCFYPDIRMTVSNVETALVLVSSQLGITFVPEIFARQGRYKEQVCYYNIKGFHDTRQICIVLNRNHYQSQQAEQLIELFKEMTPQIYGYRMQ